MTRRTFVPALAASFAGAAAAQEAPARKGRLHQCVTTGVFRGSGMSLDEMARAAAAQGAYGFDLIGPKDWPVLKQHGLVPTMMPPPWGGTIPDGLNRKENHPRIEKTIREAIDLCAANGAP